MNYFIKILTYISFLSVIYSISLQEVYDESGPYLDYDKYIILEPNQIYNGGLGIFEGNIYINCNGSVIDLQNPTSMPDPTKIKFIEEPWIKATIITPDEYLGAIMKICQDKRGVQKDLSYSGSRAVIVYEIPLNEVVFDFYDRLKSITSGYASFDYEIIGYREGNLVKLGILVNNEPVDALSMVIHQEFAQKQGRLVCEKLKDLIPRHNFMIPIQAAIGGKIIARETIKGYKKDVLTKIHGGGALDRKRKLLEKQKKGKARAKQFGKVEIPQEAFIGVLKIDK